MIRLTNFPLVVLVVSFLVLFLAGAIGTSFRKRKHLLDNAVGADAGLVLGARLTILGLIIGFTFSMAISRYDQRKNYEEAEANAIGTEYVRADLLPEADAARVRELLRQYTDLRIRFYEDRDTNELRLIDADTSRVQDELWAAASRPALAQPTPVIALAVGGMNDVLNSQGYTQAAWWNRIPTGAWCLMFVIAIFSNGL